MSKTPICAGTYGEETTVEYMEVRGEIASIEVGDEVAGFVKKSAGQYVAFSPSTGWFLGEFGSFADAFKAAAEQA